VHDVLLALGVGRVENGMRVDGLGELAAALLDADEQRVAVAGRPEVVSMV
jgi:hypothetical protein